MAVIAAALTLAYSPTLAALDRFPTLPRGDDWYKECALNKSARDTILRHRQLPLRSPYLGGGYPLIAYPEDSSLSPLFLATLLLGENAGLKIKILIKLLAGGLGMYYLLRTSLRCPPGAATLGALFFGLSEWFHSKTGAGYLGHTNYYFLPLMMGLLLDAARGRRSVLLPAVLFAVMLVDGKYAVPTSLLFLAVWGVPEVVRIGGGAVALRLAFVQKLAMVVALGCLLSMVKVLPMAGLLRTNARSVPSAALWGSLRAAPTLFYDAAALRTALVEPGAPVGHLNIGLGWVPVGLAVLAVLLRPRGVGRWAAVLLLFAWLCMGYRAPVDLWRLLWHVPVFGSINKPAFSINFFILMPLCVLAASLFRGELAARARVPYAAYLCVGAIGAALLLHGAYRVNAGHFTEALGARPSSAPFCQVEGNGEHHTYHNMVQNVGTIDWDGDILLPEFAVPRFFIDEAGTSHDNPDYRGGAWLAEGDGHVRITRFTPNVIELQVVSTRSTAVVINQNFHPRWRSSRGAVTSHQGLLSVTGLPGGPPYTVTLRYRSSFFLAGLALSIASVAGVLWLAVRRIRAHGVAGALQGVAPPDGWQPREVRIPYAAWCGRTRIVVAIAVCASLVALWLLAIPALRADYMLRAAELARAAGARDLAADLCGRVLQVDRDNGPAREILGACYHEEGRWREAAAELEWAARLGKLQAMSYYRLALSYERLGQLGDAERAWRTLVAVGPYDRLAWRALRARLAGPEPEAGLRPAPGAGGTRTRAIWQREAQ